jgi:beta-glucosidase
MPYYNRPSNALSGAQLQKDWWVSPTQQFEDVGGAYNQTLLTKLLRGYLGFKGYVNTDSGILSNTDWGADALTVPQRFAKSVKAGANIFADNNDPSGLLDAVKQGLLTEEDLNPSVRFLLAEMFKLGLFENPYNDPAQADAIANSPSSQMVADEAHRQSLVLMRNDRHLLPLKDAVKLYVEVFTPDAAAGNRGGGRNPGAGNPGAGNRVAGAAAATQTASLKTLLANEQSVHIVDTIGEANVALLWLEPSQFELADKSRVDIALGKDTGIDVAKVQKIEATVPTVLAINFATAWVINDVEPGAAAVVGTFDVKAQALLDLVRGRFLPSGKLPISIPANEAAVDANASDVPGYLESFDYSYKNVVNDRYIFGFGMTKF